MSTVRFEDGRPASAAPVGAGRHAAGAGTPWYRTAWIWTSLGLLLISLLTPAVALGWYQYEHTDRIYRGVGALGVDLSGMTRQQAERVLATRAAELTARPIAIRAVEQQWRTDWGSLGLRLPTASLVDRAFAVGRDGSPIRRVGAQLDALRAGVVIRAEQSFDDSAVAQFLTSAAGQVDRPVRDARLELKPDLTLELTTAQIGRKLDVDQSVQRLREAVNGPAEAVDLPVILTEPTTTDQMRAPARERAEQILAAPLTMTYGDRRWVIERQELANLLLFKGGPGVPLEVALDNGALANRLNAIAAELNQPAQDAKLDWNGGSPRPISPSREGRALDPAAATQLVAEKAATAERTIPLPVQVVKPAVDATQIGRMGLREQIDSATTTFAGSVPQKAHNIQLAASRLHGAVVPPRGLFSFNKTLGPTTVENGYQTAFAITSVGEQHRTVPSVAGGICQVATTLFQPVFWSGYQIEERNWHLYWIPAYTSRGVPGLDATVDEDANLDLQFFNNTDSFLLIQAKTSADSVTFELYGTKPSWTVKVDGPVITDKKAPDPAPITQPEPSLPEGQRIVVETPREGFTATFVRSVTEGGNVRNLKLESRYVPAGNVTLVGTGGRSGPGNPNDLNRPVANPSGRT